MDMPPESPSLLISLLPLLTVSMLFALFASWLAPRKGKSSLLALFVFVPCGGILVVLYLLALTDKKVLDDIEELKSRLDRQ